MILPTKSQNIPYQVLASDAFLFSPPPLLFFHSFHHPKGLIDLGFVFHLDHVNLPVHRRGGAELPAGRQWRALSR